MIISRLSALRTVHNQLFGGIIAEQRILEQMKRRATHFRSGAVKPKPAEMPLGLMGVLCAVVPGLFIGAAISKSVANFLEENDLFVPSDDDDDDDED